MTQIDPDLRRSLEQARTENASLHVILTLDRTSVASGTAAEVGAVVHRLVGEASESSHQRPTRVVVFSSLNAFAMEAPAMLVKSLLESPGVASATLAH